MLKLYNTLTRKKEEFKPINPLKVGMYTCGPTVYDHTHVGHMRTYVNTDILRRVLEYNNFQVKQVQNITDVGHLTSDADAGEDKLEKKAREDKLSVWDIAKQYTDEFYSTMDKLNVLRPHIICKATDHIKEMIQLVQELEKRGFTYIIEGDGVYFDTSKFKDYGKLARLDIEGLKPGARVEYHLGKKNITDFALWMFTKKGESRQMEWESPWSKKSFPGWHIECSTLSMKYLTNVYEDGKFNPEKFETIDLHSGGIDHIPVHHPNEIAQSETATGKQFVKYWFHNEFMMVEGEKMSKSLRNFYWMKDIEDRGFEPLALRYLFFTAHYRSKLNFSFDSLKATQSTLNNLREEIANWERKGKVIESFDEEFLKYINDDLDMPKAIALLWEMVKSNEKTGDKYQTILKWDQVLGLKLEEIKKPEVYKYQGVLSSTATISEIELSEKEQDLIDRRAFERKHENYAKADILREKIEKEGLILEDTNEGTVVKKKT